jgi:hypothetical protein
MAVDAQPNNGACTGILVFHTRVLVTALPAWVVCIHESQSKTWGFPGRELTKISKKNTQHELILKGEMGDSSSFRHGETSQLLE